MRRFSFGPTEKYELDVDRPLFDQFLQFSADPNSLPDYFCEIHLLINDYVPMKQLGNASSDAISGFIEKANSDLMVASEKKRDSGEKTRDSFPKDQYQKEKFRKDDRRTKKSKWKRNLAIVAVSILLVAIASISGVVYLHVKNNAIIDEFQTYLTDNAYSNAVHIYNTICR